ncbi:phosphatase PAP2 family protein [Rhodococcus spelaei]|nr:phosphatase PAP2 family protein [Rhodococcus spelaei]
MSHSIDAVRVLVTELHTEESTAEVALWTLGACALAFTGSLAADRWNRRRGEVSFWTAFGWSMVRIGSLLAALALLAVQVRTAGWITRADPAVGSWFAGHQSPALVSAATWVTRAGSPVSTAVVAVAVAALLARRHRSALPAAVLAGTVALAAVASVVVKDVVARPRPSRVGHLAAATDYSFPSGHVTGTVALLGALLVLMPAGVGPLRRTVAAASATVVVIAVAASRLYLGVHWLTDVVGGLLLGVAAVLVGALAAATWSARFPTVTRFEDRPVPALAS